MKHNLSKEQYKTFHELSLSIASLTLSSQQICDLELIMNGAFNPLKTFLNQNDYNNVLNNMRLSDGTIWPIPIMLDVSNRFIDNNKISINDEIALRDQEGFLLAIMKITDVWNIDKNRESNLIYGTDNIEHPGVHYLIKHTKDVYITGKLTKINDPKHYDFESIRLRPDDVKSKFRDLNWDNIIAFQTRNPMHKAHKEIVMRAMNEYNAGLLIHPAVGRTKPGDVDYFTRVKCYQHILNYFPKKQVILNLIPLAMRMAGPREALWHAIIRKNYGCTHFIVGRDHAGPGKDSSGNNFYGPYEAQDLLKQHQEEIDIQMVPFKMLVYAPLQKKYFEIDKVPENVKIENISGTQFREYLEQGEDIPEWYSFPEIIEELRRVYPVKEKQGFTLFFTGLSGSGKSTIANGVMTKLMEHGKRRITLLDGDLVRTHLSSELGFSKEHRDINITRIGFVASEITKNGGIAICAPIAPYQIPRIENRNLINKYGSYIEVYISTPIEECEKRDVKGLYAKARAGEIKGFTGIDDPYEEPKKPEIVIDTTNISQEDSVNIVIDYLLKEGFLK